jgi:hypothetical protein
VYENKERRNFYYGQVFGEAFTLPLSSQPIQFADGISLNRIGLLGNSRDRE